MTKIRINKLIWDAYNTEHIKKHNVTTREVEDVGKYFLAHKKGKVGRYLLIGRTGTRVIAVVVNRNKPGVYYPVTARDADKKERSILYEKEKRNKK